MFYDCYSVVMMPDCLKNSTNRISQPVSSAHSILAKPGPQHQRALSSVRLAESTTGAARTQCARQVFLDLSLLSIVIWMAEAKTEQSPRVESNNGWVRGGRFE